MAWGLQRVIRKWCHAAWDYFRETVGSNSDVPLPHLSLFIIVLLTFEPKVMRAILPWGISLPTALSV